mmetsp:Transcript_12186/g.28422  ORF Transcript_12186/g.28422 Transcript_12186/m.28422 type:complete len:233 (-) Transcript_12186:70-768(-)
MRASSDNMSPVLVMPVQRQRETRRVRSLGLAAIVGLVVINAAAWCVQSTCVVKYSPYGLRIPTGGKVTKGLKRYTVLLLKDEDKLGEAGDIVRVKRGRYRNDLLPRGVAKIVFNADVAKGDKKKADRKMAQDLLEGAYQAKAKIESGTYVWPKKVRPGTTKIYGGLTPIQVKEAILEQTKESVRATAIQLPKIIELGKYAATIEIEKGVNAYIEVEIVDEDAKDDDGEEEEE